MSKRPASRLSQAEPDFLRLSLCYLEDELDAEGVEKLQTLLRADPAKRNAFVRLCLTGSALIEAISEGASGTVPGWDLMELDAQTDGPQSKDLNETMFLPALTAEEIRSDQVEVVLPPAPVIMPPAHPVSLFRRRWLWAASIMIPLLAGFVVYRLIPRHYSYATVASSIDADWMGVSDQLQEGQRLPETPLFLQRGVAEIKFDSGATMIVEAPARFQVRAANSVELISGQLSAKVPVGAHGFAVETATTRIVDLGTEFGVAIAPDGLDEIQVFKGSVRAEPQAAGSVAPLLISEGQAAVSTGREIKLDPAGAQPQAFVRSLSTPVSIDVVDLICGGDGTTHRRSGAIDQRTGESGPLTSMTGPVVVPSVYHEVPRLQVVDGCFVPNGTDVVDSVQQTFDFGATNGRTLYKIIAGGTVPWPVAGETFSAVLGGVDYSQPGHGLILLHPNIGITFDLVAIRRIHPGLKVADFRAVVGNTCPNARRSTVAHVFVLVDGGSRYDLPRLTHNNGAPADIRVPLTDADRFLTIAITDNRTIVSQNWIILGDPRLE